MSHIPLIDTHDQPSHDQPSDRLPEETLLLTTGGGRCWRLPAEPVLLHQCLLRPHPPLLYVVEPGPSHFNGYWHWVEPDESSPDLRNLQDSM